METLQKTSTCHGQAAMQHPLVSVVMPAYNAEKYIGEAIRSVQSQTYTNWVLLVIDDCSTDHTVDVVQAFVNTDDRIRLFRNTRNLGAAKTRNRGLELSEGEWVALLDSDDIWHSDKLEKQLAVALNSGSEIIYCSCSLISSDGEKISDYIVPAQTSYDDMLKESVFSCSTTLLAKNVVDNNRFSADYYHEDLVYWLQLLKKGYSASACCEPLADYRIVEGSRSHSKVQSAKNRWEVYRKVEKLSLLKSLSVFLSYTARGLRKYKRVTWMYCSFAVFLQKRMKPK
mgnify:FL=1